MKNIIILIAILLSQSYINAQQLEWAFGIGSTDIDASDKVKNIVSDTLNNIYVAGTFEDIADFDGTSGGYFMNAYGTNSTYNDLFLAKYSKDKNLIWAFKLSGIKDDEPNSIAVDNDQNVYLSGTIQSSSVWDSIDFNPNAGIVNIALGSTINFIAKYDINGNLMWLNDTLLADFMEVDDNGNLFCLIGGDVRKFDSNGNMLWNVTMPTAIADISIEDDGDFLVSGMSTSWGSVDLDPGTGTHMVNMSNGFTYVSRFDNNGVFEDAFEIEWSSSISYVTPYGLKSLSNGGVVISGYFSDSADFDPSSGAFVLTPVKDPLSIISNQKNTFFAKYDSLGNLFWSKQISGDNYNLGMDVDAGENIYLNGKLDYNANSDFDPGVGIYLLYSEATDYVAKYNGSGDLTWVAGFEPINTGSGNYSAWFNGFEVDKLGNAYLVGQFTNRNNDFIDFDPDPTNDFNLFCYGTSSQSDGDGFVLKLSPWAVGIENEEVNGTVQVYPIPAKEEVNIELNHYPEYVNMQLFDVSGKVFYNHTYSKVNSISLNINNLPSGLYFIQLIINEDVSVRKFIKE
ncbi:MAG: hypothetical protein COB15_01540 [Flavobacteriales bacterium]|nr:MAG: hypothetical protein COB15_01540 [Flavobacteriales bacterium]